MKFLEVMQKILVACKLSSHWVEKFLSVTTLKTF
jgi:hypothetical protein